MTDRLAHRGPDGQGVYTNSFEGIALGQRRLKIIGKSDTPGVLKANSHDVWTTFNGEIYNFKELKRELSSRNYTFRTDTDTEVLLNCYLEFGADFITRLNGDFSFAIWDGRSRELHLYRDPLGVRPLYYSQSKDSFSFASEIKALFERNDVKPSLNTAKLNEFLGHLFITGSDTLYQDIYEVLPGEHIVVRDGKMKRRKYHNFSYDPSIREASLEDQISGFWGLFDDAVQCRLQADVPVGLFLSGGIDSTAIMDRVHKAGVDLDGAYNLGFAVQGQSYDEFTWFRQVSERIPGKYREILVQDVDFQDLISKVTTSHDEPLPHIVSAPQYLLAKAASKEITVALLGTGGDELFCGYTHYLAAEHLFNAKGENSESDVEKSAYQAGLRDDFIAGEFKSCTQKYLVDALLMPEVQFDADYREKYASLFSTGGYPDFQSKMLHMDIQSHLVAVLNKDDKMNMAFGMEGRFPFLDHRVVSYALSMDPALKVKDGCNKFTLKEELRSIFPEDFIDREKTAFMAPVQNWFYQEASHLNFVELRSRLKGLLNGKKLDKIVSEFRQGKIENQRRLWGLFSLEKWMVEQNLSI